MGERDGMTIARSREMTRRQPARLSDMVPEPHIIPSRDLLWYLTNRWLDDPRWQPYWRALVAAMVAWRDEWSAERRDAAVRA